MFGELRIEIGEAISKVCKIEGAEIVRYIFSMAVSGMNRGQIARQLFEEGIPTATKLHNPKIGETKRCLTWSPTTVRKILANRFYPGEMAYGKSIHKSVGSKDGILGPKDQWKVIKAHHEPLVEPEIFAYVNKRASAGPVRVNQRKEGRHPLTGKIYCGGCWYVLGYKRGERGKGSGGFGGGRHGVLQIPQCCTYLQEMVLEETVLMLLNRELLIRGDLIRRRERLEAFQRGGGKAWGRKAEHRKRYEEIQKRKDYLYISYVTGEIKVQEYRNKADGLESELKEVFCQIEETAAKYNSMEEELHKDKQEMKQIIRFSRLEELYQEVVGAFIKKVVVYGEKRVEIEWEFLEFG